LGLSSPALDADRGELLIALALSSLLLGISEQAEKSFSNQRARLAQRKLLKIIF
jgi:type II secretory pathway component PulJ